MVSKDDLSVGMFYKRLNGIGRIIAISEKDEMVTIRDLDHSHTTIAHVSQLDPGLVLDESMMWDCED
ncbi:hypothetical protein [Gallaecimonas pentaromativorans]|uniref:Uncharacterized protein n=1 Tax=Gallaecimonas pentaromativorans TaxID=584787 RepID=A0A3N1PVV7_9GAMM|nr:hypothetical protein [Gallaecimonas pentaromativorans]MED5524686.1 hypothetical protein [Pseudomonadota bacterium]ROQ28676.1 hypothetical protein EDC28_103269 [Gallaecimonas pentaromativorans]